MISFKQRSITVLIIIYFLLLGCNNQEKWKALPLNIKKQESYNYSEIISGKLDSTQKTELEQVRKNISKETTDLSQHIDQNRKQSQSTYMKKILGSINKIYNWLLNLF